MSARSGFKAAAREVGIDPARVEDAARAVALDSGNRPNRILGGPTVVNFERKVERKVQRLRQRSNGQMLAPTFLQGDSFRMVLSQGSASA